MKVKDFVDRIADDYDITKEKARGIYDTLIDMVTEAVLEEEKVDLKDFVTITVRNTKARKGRNPRTGEVVDIPAKKKLSFRPKPFMKRLINKEK